MSNEEEEEIEIINTINNMKNVHDAYNYILRVFLHDDSIEINDDTYAILHDLYLEIESNIYILREDELDYMKKQMVELVNEFHKDGKIQYKS